MIVFKIYTDEDIGISQPHRFGEQFQSILKPDSSGQKKGPKAPCAPFRDDASRKVLRAAGYTFADEANDWYSVVEAETGRRMNLCHIPDAVQFVLAAIDASRRGEYLWYEEAYYNLEPEFWKVLAGLPFDVLLGLHFGKTLFIMEDAHIGDILITGCPYGGRRIEITVKNGADLEGDPFYTALPTDSWVSCLFLGQDGRHYISSTSWIGDILYPPWPVRAETLLHYIDKAQRQCRPFNDMGCRCITLAEPCRAYPLSELQCRLEVGPGDLRLWGLLMETSNSQHSADDDMRVVCHLKETPMSTDAKWPAVLAADHLPDGSWLLHDQHTVKYPNFAEMLGSVADAYRTDHLNKTDRDPALPELDRMVLIVDVNAPLHAPSDLQHTVVGFRLCGSTIDVYAPEDALYRFGRALHLALASGNCRTAAGEP